MQLRHLLFVVYGLSAVISFFKIQTVVLAVLMIHCDVIHHDTNDISRYCPPLRGVTVLPDHGSECMFLG